MEPLLRERRGIGVRACEICESRFFHGFDVAPDAIDRGVVPAATD